MSESKQSAPLLEGLLIGEPMSEHHGVRCCPAIRENTDDRYIVKILSIPASQVQLDALLLTGAYSTPAQALEYFHELAREVVTEANTLDRLAKLEGFLSFTGTEIRKMKNGIGYQVYLLSPYKRSLERQMQLQPLTHLGAVNLGLDLCAALAICRRSGYLYIDLKPSNIFITQNQGCRIGDLGFLPLNTLKYASFPEKYRSPYTAPEIKDAMSTLNDTLDIYALGLVLYQVYNNGQLPFEGTAPEMPLAPPMYADYEISEIILKACDPDPAKRWADPIQMGQALVAYMQRNSINDTPIIPPPVETPPEPEPQEEEEEFLTEEENEETVGELLDSILGAAVPPPTPPEELPQIVTDSAPAVQEADEPDEDEELPVTEYDGEDETTPNEEVVAELPDAPVSAEVEQILAQADELITHVLPEPAVAPEPIDVPFPAPITVHDPLTADILEDVAPEPEEVEAELPDAEEAESVGEEAEADIALEEPVDDTEDDEEYEEASETIEQIDQEKYEYECGDDQDPEDPQEMVHIRKRSTKKSRILITVTSCLLLLVALCVSGALFYQFYYLQPIEFLTIDGSVDSLTTVIGSGIRDELLEVVCTDTYGNTRKAEVLNGRAHFTNLTPNTQYRVQVNISGFHQLTGVTTGSYTTAAQTEILNFTAAAGPEDGSVILSFTVNGPETDTWTIGYSTGNAQEKTQTFTGHTVTVSDLIIGSEYLFRLIPSDEQYLTGSWQLNYTAQQVVYAQELAIRSCGNGVLVAAWNVPEGLENQNWNVRCYNDNGYDETITTGDAQAQFTGLDHAYGYTVEVTAVGMTQSATASVSANPITITDVTVTPADSGVLQLKWTFSGEAPADGWIVDYTIDGGTPITLSCTKGSAEIPQYPGSRYEIDVRPVGEVTFYGKHISYDVEEAKEFASYGVTASDMSFYMCRTPDKKKWDRFDVPADDYVTEFKVGEKASFLVELWQEYESSDDAIAITYIIRDEADQPLSAETVTSSWNEMWEKRFCELDIPKMPETAGKYTVEIYFNNRYITTEAFTVK